MRYSGWKQGQVFCVGPHRPWPVRTADSPAERARIARWDVLSPLPEDAVALLLHDGPIAWAFDRRAVEQAVRLAAELTVAPAPGTLPLWVSWPFSAGSAAALVAPQSTAWPGVACSIGGRIWLFHPAVAGPYAYLDPDGQPQATADVRLREPEAAALALRCPRLALGQWDGRYLIPLKTPEGWYSLPPLAPDSPLAEGGAGADP